MLKFKISDRTATALRYAEIAAGVLLVLAGIASRFYKLGHESVWLDESITFIRSSMPIDHLLHDTIKRHHVPPYFLLMHWVLQFGDDEFMLRLPSAVFASLALLAATALGRIIGGWRTGIVTAVLFALSPELLRYSQEARMYAMLICFSTTALCGLLWLVKQREAAASWPFREKGVAALDPQLVRRTRAAWLVYAFGVIGVLYTHNTAALFWAACWAVGGVLFLASPGRRRAFLLNWLAANGLVLLVFSAWLKILFQQTKDISDHFWAKFPTGGMIAGDLGDLYLLGAPHAVQGFVVIVFALFALWALRKQPVLLIALLLLSVLQPAMILVISLKRPIWITRVMLWGTIPFFALVACGITELKNRALIAFVVGVLLVAGGSALNSSIYDVYRKPQWSRALRELAATPGGAPPIIMIGPKSHRPIIYYTERRIDRLPPFEVAGCRPPTLDQELTGRRRVVIFVADKGKYVRPILAMMKTRGKLRRKVNYGHALTLYEYRVYDAYANPTADSGAR